jgi:hypothetical protein
MVKGWNIGWRLGAAALCALLAGGCMAFCPAPSPQRKTTQGEVRMLDFATCRRLRVLTHTAERGRHGLLHVTVRFRNSSDAPYRAEVRRRFVDDQGRAEDLSYRWYRKTFPTGYTTQHWVSYTGEAVRYQIDLRSAH